MRRLLALMTVVAAPLAAQQRPAARPVADSGQADSAGRPPLDGLRFRALGPAVTSGRIADLAIHPAEPHTWYVATASGGVWKTVNAGTTFAPIFDSQGSFSTGAIAIDPRDPSVVWVGTGENNSLRSVAYGDGVYKSVDGGRTWTNVGLRESEHIGRILIDPRDSKVVYVAAQGPLWRGGGERGLYKTTDGGATWTRILGGGDWVGVNDVQFDPRDPDVLIASTHQRQRRVWGQVNGGPESGIHRSTDGGATWTRVRSGLPTEDVGRIGLAVSPADPRVVYAIIEGQGDAGGFYRSTDRGASWQRMSARGCLGLFYCEIFADPTQVDRVYAVETNTGVSTDGGRTWTPVPGRNRHVDDHVVWIDPRNADHLLIGGDGGLYESYDRGATWRWMSNLPLTQFYRIAVDERRPFYHVYGGTQDNNTIGGPSRTHKASGIENADWYVTTGGDGFTVQIDPTDPDIVYSESQNGGMWRHDRRTGENVSIRPLPEPGEPELRWYWDTPILISPHDPRRLYVGAQRLFRSDDRGDSWRALSGDLTRQIDRNTLRLMGRVWPVDAVGKNQSTSFYGTIITISESPRQEGLLYVGTDDGLIQVSEDGGATWRRIASFPGVPETTYVQRVVASRHDANTVYAAFNNHRSGDFAPYLLKSTDRGRTWRSIAANLPARGSVYGFVEDPRHPDLLFVGTEFQLFVSFDGGGRWHRLSAGLPTIQMRDLAIQAREDDLVVGTFGRGVYILDDISPLRAMAERRGAPLGDLVFPMRDAPLYLPSRPSTGSHGATHFSAPNPPVGATITYHLAPAPRTARARRQEQERAAARGGRDVAYPSWAQLRAEEGESEPLVVVTILDADGRVVNRLRGTARAGINRVTWDLRYMPAAPQGVPLGGGAGAGGAAAEEEPSPFAPSLGQGRGPLASPGRYTAVVAVRTDSGEREIGRQAFTAEPPAPYGVTTARGQEVRDFRLATARLQGQVQAAQQVITATAARLDALQRAIDLVPGPNDALRRDARRIGVALDSLRRAFAGNPEVSRRNEPDPPAVAERVNAIVSGAWTWAGDATATLKRQYAIVAEALPPLLARLDALVTRELGALEQAAERAGAPWTPGRRLVP